MVWNMHTPASPGKATCFQGKNGKEVLFLLEIPALMKPSHKIRNRALRLYFFEFYRTLFFLELSYNAADIFDIE